jgi:hypothetical protein
MTTLGRVGLGRAGVAAAAAVGVAVWLAWPRPDEGITVDAVRPLGEPTVGEHVTAVVTLTNRTPRPVRVLGNEPMACGNNVCYGARAMSPTDLFPGDSMDLEYTLMPRKPGPFSGSTGVFVHRDGHVERVVVPFEGVTRPGPGPAD